MITLDDLMREFRADLPDPDDGAQERILQRARRAHEEALERTVAPRRRRRFAWQGPLRWAVVPVGAAVLATLVVALALAPVRDRADHGVPAVPGLVARAEAAVSAPHKILALSIRIRRSTTDPRATARDETTNVEQWTMAGAGRAMAWRSLITDGPLGEPPTDEDSTVHTDRAGRVIDQRWWTPLGAPGSRRGELWIGGPIGQPGPRSLAEQLRDVYAPRLLRPAGRTADGSLRLRGGPVLGGTGRCVRSEVVLDPSTFIPREVTITGGSASCRTSTAPTERGFG